MSIEQSLMAGPNSQNGWRKDGTAANSVPGVAFIEGAG
jgi:hypothetical protein